MGKKGKNNPTLGRSLIKDRFGSRKPTAESFLHTSELNDGFDWNRINFASVTEESSLEEFLATAELAGTEFTAEKLNVQIVNSELYTGLLSSEQEQSVKEAQQVNRNLLKIPRRPAWDENTTPEELEEKERDSFLEWRRNLALLQEKEHIVLTPFEKNLEFWRQLWRVIERSDVLVQIVDGRNPLLYRSTDLESYVTEVNPAKVNMILVNKADYLTDAHREHWARYFDSVGIRVAFWSATMETERNKVLENHSDTQDSANEESEDESLGSEEDEGMSDNEVASDDKSSDNEHPQQATGLDDQTDCDTNVDKKLESLQLGSSDNEEISQEACGSSDGKIRNSSKLLDGHELVDLFRSVYSGHRVHEEYLTVGFVGYPNVGKSSTINALIQTKKVSVSATPGHTKHFQTLYLAEDLLLCDCPGLVMPSFVSTKADLVVSGILPIDQQRDLIPPVSLVCRHIPRPVLEATYGIMLPKPKEGEDPDRPPTAYELLGTYGCMRGYMTHKGVPDMPRSARCILKDYVTGKLLFCHPPPGVKEEQFVSAGAPHKPLKLKREPVLMKLPKGARPKDTSKPSELDSQFFNKSESRIGSRGVQGVLDYSRKAGLTAHHGSQSTTHAIDKPWRKHHNRGKKEKLRRKHAHHDIQ